MDGLKSQGPLYSNNSEMQWTPAIGYQTVYF